MMTGMSPRLHRRLNRKKEKETKCVEYSLRSTGYYLDTICVGDWDLSVI